MQNWRIRTDGPRIFSLVAGIVGLIGTGAANALSIGFDDPNFGGAGFDVVVTDGDVPDDGSAASGQVSWSGSIGNWSVSATGTGDFVSDPILNLQSLDASTESNSTETLIVAVWDESLTDPHPFRGAAEIIDDALGGTLNVTFSQFTDGSTSSTGVGDTSVGTLGHDTSVSISDVSDTPKTPLSNDFNPYDLGIVATIEHTHGGSTTELQTNFNASIKAVPLPAAAWLMGSALVLLAGIGRRASRRRNYSMAST